MPVLFLGAVALRRTGTTPGSYAAHSPVRALVGHLTLLLWDDAGTTVAVWRGTVRGFVERVGR